MSFFLITPQFRRHQSIVYYHTINIMQPQDHWLFVLLFTIRWTREMFFERSTSTCVIREFKISTTWTATRTSQLMTFLCFPSKKLTAKINKKNDSMVNLIQETLRKKTRRKPASGYQKKTKLIYRRAVLQKFWSKLERLCFPHCVTQRHNFTFNWDAKRLYKIYLMAPFIQYN